MTSDPESQTPGTRPARLRLVRPIALVAAGLAVFMALFWENGGHGKKGHGRRGGEGNAHVTGSGSPVGGGPSRSGPRAKGETWWYQEGDRKSDRGPDRSEGWWSPGKGGGKNEADEGSPVGGSRRGRNEAEGAKETPSRRDRESRTREKPAQASPMNPGEAAGQTGPDDFWWRK